MIFLLLVPVVLGGFTQSDLNCTTDAVYVSQRIYTDQATMCQNVQSDAVCKYFYGDPVLTNSQTNRNSRCFNGFEGPVQQDFQRAAVMNCARTCGYCCLTPEFKCDNKRNPRLNCNSITLDMCRSPTWRALIAEDCPNRCGFCLDGNCIDIAPDCKNQPQICNIAGLEVFVFENCKRTCGFC